MRCWPKRGGCKTRGEADMRLRPGARSVECGSSRQRPDMRRRTQPLRPCPKEPLRGHASGAHIGEPSTVSPGAKRRANPEGVSLMDETNNTADALFGRNPEGRGDFRAFRCYSPLAWITKRRGSRLEHRRDPVGEASSAGAAANAPTSPSLRRPDAVPHLPLRETVDRSVHRKSLTVAHAGGAEISSRIG